MPKVTIYVKEYYMYTPWAARANASATGTPRQDVVKTQHGTVTWIPNDKRIVVADVSKSLQAKITTRFDPWDPQTDMARHYHRSYRSRATVHVFSREGANN